MGSKSRARLGLWNIRTQRLGPFRPGHLHQNDVGFEEGELIAQAFPGASEERKVCATGKGGL